MKAMPSSSVLSSPWRLGPYTLANRVVMAPMTRCRAGEGRVPTDLMARYYAQRASGGLLITEATQVSPQGIGYPNTPGIHTPEQVGGWKKITQAVHDLGGRIFLQLWHCGRISHPLWQDGGVLPVSASAIAPKGQTYTPEGMKAFVVPRALDAKEIPGVVAQYRRGAECALEAGFDGVELHGANGYLVDQFLRDGTNQRADAYGGPAENRVRFLAEVTRALIGVWGPDRVGVRLSPSGTFNDMRDSAPLKTFSAAIKALDALGIAYVHLVEGTGDDVRHGGVNIPTAHFRELFRGTLIVCSEYTRERAEAMLAAKGADLIAFARLFLANPDLPRRLAHTAPLNAPDPATFYGGGEKGYTDYPALEA